MGTDSGRVAHPYGELIALAEREHRVIATRDHEALAELATARASLMAKLPERAPVEAHDAIRHLTELQERNEAALEEAMQGLGVDLSRLRAGRAGVRLYAPRGDAARRLDFSA
ncbi:MAG: hypothetical protein ACJ768_02030 [Gaiellaceae bacterium]